MRLLRFPEAGAQTKCYSGFISALEVKTNGLLLDLRTDIPVHREELTTRRNSIYDWVFDIYQVIQVALYVSTLHTLKASINIRNG